MLTKDAAENVGMLYFLRHMPHLHNVHVNKMPKLYKLLTLLWHIAVKES